MRPIPGMRPPVAKLINDIERINDSEVLYKYIEDIASFYTSDYKTEKKIIEQHETDIKKLVCYYNMVNERYVGYEPKTELEKALRPKIEPDKRYGIIVSNLRDAIYYLIHYAASNKIFLPLEKLEELGLMNIKHNRPIVVPKIDEVPESFKANSIEEYWKEFQRVNAKNKGKFERVIESVYDSAISFYKAHGYIINIPEIPQKLQRIFKYDKKIYHRFCKECEGKDLEGVALLYIEYVKAGHIDKDRAMKPIYHEFVSKDDSQYMTFTRRIPESLK